MVILGTALIQGILALALCALVLVATPRRTVHLLLAGYLGAVALNSAGMAIMAAGRGAFVVYHGELYSAVGAILVAATYPLFAAASLDVPLARPLRRPVARAAAAVAASVAIALLFARPREIVSGLTTDAEGVPFPVSGPSAGLLFVVVAIVGLYTLTCAILALRRAPSGSAARRRAAWYAWAFGAHDLFVIGGSLFVVAMGLGSVATYAWSVVIFGVGIGAALILVTIAMLREHLFDADLKLKAGLRRGSVAAVFLGAFFIVAAVAEQYLQQFGVVVGGVAVGLLLFALRPLERFAGRLADAAMPRVHDTHEYRTVRKREVYRAAVETAMEGGAITERERSVLATLAQELGLGPRDALDVEREARAAVAARAA